MVGRRCEALAAAVLQGGGAEAAAAKALAMVLDVDDAATDVRVGAELVEKLRLMAVGTAVVTKSVVVVTESDPPGGASEGALAVAESGGADDDSAGGDTRPSGGDTRLASSVGAAAAGTGAGDDDSVPEVDGEDAALALVCQLARRPRQCRVLIGHPGLLATLIGRLGPASSERVSTTRLTASGRALVSSALTTVVATTVGQFANEVARTKGAPPVARAAAALGALAKLLGQWEVRGATNTHTHSHTHTV
eukprot:585824-Prorocentrum_minimum.AAC.4